MSSSIDTLLIATVEFSSAPFISDFVGFCVSESAASVKDTVDCALPADAPKAAVPAVPAVLALPDKLPLNVGAVIPTLATTPCEACTDVALTLGMCAVCAYITMFSPPIVPLSAITANDDEATLILLDVYVISFSAVINKVPPVLLF